MKRYYKGSTWYKEGDSITIYNNGNLFSGIPTEEQLLQFGFTEYIEPTPSEEQLLQRAKERKIQELLQYDNSSEVNSFSINSKELWLNANMRQQLKMSLDAYKETGETTVTKWFEGEEYTFDINTWYYMLNLLEVYASDALNVTENHKAAINNLTSIEDINNYDYTVGYPEHLVL